MVDFARKFCNTSLDPQSGGSATGELQPYSDADKLKALRAAVNHCKKEQEMIACLLQVAAHSKRTKQCAKGLGVDRHLYALKCLWSDVQQR